MAGLHIEVKCKGIDAYSLGGVKKIEFERHEHPASDTPWDYIATTIHDTRKYAIENVEYIKIFGGAEREMPQELRYIVEFVRDKDFGYDTCRKQLRSLWTAYCLHRDYECDTLGYDGDLKIVWDALEKNTSHPWCNDDEDGIIGFELFDMYMCEEVC